MIPQNADEAAMLALLAIIDQNFECLCKLDKGVRVWVCDVHYEYVPGKPKFDGLFALRTRAASLLAEEMIRNTGDAPVRHPALAYAPRWDNHEAAA